MSVDTQLASGKTAIFEAVLGFLPDWVQIGVLGLVLLVVVASWGVGLKRRVGRRRAARNAPVVPRQPQGSGADHLGPWAPQQRSEQGSGADYLGAYAPPRRPGGTG
ncbi:hypothetical protein [Streptomyces sp. NPDC006997]|uniref:hypothetical protein n=1 Tax=Streptomyces sp. NPDC006997 TaxID=3155356 RepID=UPI0033CDE366